MPSDAEYLSAVEAGDMVKTQELVDQAAKAAGYTVGPVYHGTNAEFTEFKPSRIGNFGPGIYVAFDEGSATSYAKRIGGNKVLKAYAMAKNPIIGKDATDAANKLFEMFPGATDAETIQKAKDAGFDAVIASGTLKTKFGDSPAQMSVFDPSQIKSADPITRDDSGNIIPLSERFQQSSADIRYMPAPVPDPSIPGAYSMSGYRILPGKTKGKLRVYSPGGSLAGVVGSVDDAQRMIAKKLQ